MLQCAGAATDVAVSDVVASNLAKSIVLESTVAANGMLTSIERSTVVAGKSTRGSTRVVEAMEASTLSGAEAITDTGSLLRDAAVIAVESL